MTSAEVHPSDVVLPPGEPVAEPGPAAIAAAAETPAPKLFDVQAMVQTAFGLHTFLSTTHGFLASSFPEWREAEVRGLMRDKAMVQMLPDGGVRVFNLAHIVWADFTMVPHTDLPA